MHIIIIIIMSVVYFIEIYKNITRIPEFVSIIQSKQTEFHWKLI